MSEVDRIALAIAADQIRSLADSGDGHLSLEVTVPGLAGFNLREVDRDSLDKALSRIAGRLLAESHAADPLDDSSDGRACSCGHGPEWHDASWPASSKCHHNACPCCLYAPSSAPNRRP